jgi:nicotinate-nucleotide adenylyltransferase
MRTIGLLGGTFDPIHNGHLQLAQAIHTYLQLEEIRLIPAANPLLRAPPVATAAQRLAMANIAAEDYPWLKVDDREIKRGGFSYTVETLASLREEMPDTVLCFIMSADQFLQFDSWQSWERIPELAHLIVVNRSGYALTSNERLDIFFNQRRTDEVHLLHETPNGLLFFQHMDPLLVSGTQIRARLKAGESVEGLVSERVRTYISEQGLYV